MNLLKLAALAAFIVAAVIAFFVDAPDVLTILGFIAVGGACHVGSEVAG